MRTFKVSDVKVPQSGILSADSMWSVVLRDRPYGLQERFKYAGQKVEACGGNLENLAPTLITSPLIAAVHEAFDHHYPLALSPDDVWLAITQGFANHVNLNSEALRPRLIAHQGTKTLTVRRDNFVRGDPNNDWPECFSEFSNQIAEHVGEKTRDLLVGSFSTTGIVETAAFEVVLMATFSKYFSLQMLTACGIPEITLLGTVEDWESVRNRSQALGEYAPEWWIRELIPVLDKIVETAKGETDLNFWKSLYKLQDESGGPYVGGWINVFFPYIKDTDIGELEDSVSVRNSHVNWNRVVESRPEDEGYVHPSSLGNNVSDFPDGVSVVPFKWQYLSEEIPMKFLGGFVGISQDPQTLVVRPVIGWAVTDEVKETR